MVFVFLCVTSLSMIIFWSMPNFFFLFRAKPVAYGSSQVRGQSRAAPEANVTATAKWDLIHICDLH